MRLRPLGDDFLDGCAIDFLQEEITLDYEAEMLLSPLDDEGIPEAFLVSRAAAAVASQGRDLGLANRLRVAGLPVREVEGWRSRGDAVFNGKGAVKHHTAGSAVGDTPSLGICINGRSDLRGPLCNDYVGRDGIIRVVASGRANHAGSGGFNGLVGNSSVWGTEVEHTGRKLLPEETVHLLARLTAAEIEGSATEEFVCQHHEWSTAGKIDIATNFHGPDDGFPTKGQFRRLVADQLRILAEVERVRVAFPSAVWKRTERHPRGQWVRKTVVIAKGNLDEWVEARPAILERRGPGQGLVVQPV